MPWLDNFDEREKQEICFAIEYDAHYRHGTSGHLAYTVIAKLARMMDKYSKTETVPSPGPWPPKQSMAPDPR